MQQIEARIKELFFQLGTTQYNLEILSQQKAALLKEISALQQQHTSLQKNSQTKDLTSEK